MEFSGELNFVLRWLHVISGVMWIGLLPLKLCSGSVGVLWQR